MDHPRLPQQDPDPNARRSAIARSRAIYRYDYTLLPPVALAAEVPKADHPAAAWVLRVADIFVELALNSARIHAVEERLDPAHHEETHRQIQGAGHRALAATLERIQTLTLTGDTTGQALLIAEHAMLWQHWRPPMITYDFTDDAIFARMRIAGPNPAWVRRVSAIPQDFAVSASLFHAVTGARLDEELAEGRVILGDWTILRGAVAGTFQGPNPARQKYITAPYALFWWPRGGRPQPVAIQLSPAGPTFTPFDRAAWTCAKTCVQVADGNVHQAISHLARTHLVMESFALATRRCLAPSHPLSVLLLPHFAGTLSINNLAQSSLICPGGGVDVVLAGTIEFSRAAAAIGVQTYDFQASIFPTDLATRGLDSPESYPDYPYRDDASLLWDSVLRWTRAYVENWYTSDGDVAGDTELQAFFAEVQSSRGGRIQNVAPPGGVVTREGLWRIVAHVIFTGSVQHAAVNFPQEDLLAFVPNWPLAGYAPPPESNDVPRERWFDTLPPLDMSQYQLALGRLLGGVHHTRLGQYAPDTFADMTVGGALQRFQRELAAHEATILDRNTRRYPYPYLLPSGIPQSVNI